MQQKLARWTTLVGEQKFALVNIRNRRYVEGMRAFDNLFKLTDSKEQAMKFDHMSDLLRFVATHEGPHVGSYIIVVLEPQDAPWKLVTELV